ncbi:molybdate-anion transporter [Quillaja saponaria]|uniref:Molybdate-anion transporter n=1 Tax=Quillaja saponaria TaxID=32244 RepID=A0AAD7PFB3_QUISA|nr:molybdate-anion transporter [Quillaja saponaria]
MGVVIESSVWEPNPLLYIFLFFACCSSIFLFPYASSSNKTPVLFDHGISPSFLRFQRNFLLVYSLASVMEGLGSVFGEFELAYHGVSREQMVESLCVGYAAALFVGTFLGMLSDLIGQMKVCLIFCILHLFVGIWKRIAKRPSILVASICLSLANSIFSFSFETWMVIQHDKQGHRLDTLNDTFWLMTFFESGCLIGSQIFSNWLLGNNVERSTIFPSTTTIFLAILCIIFVAKGWEDNPQAASFKEYSMSFYIYILGDKRIWLLAVAQACLHFSIAVFWILWAPTVVADGREVHLGLIYPCFIGSRMLGSTTFPWLISGPSALRTEDCLVYGFAILGVVLSIVAYDYQEIGVLVTLFCLFHACVGMILPSLSRLRTLYVPDELRGGMMSLSAAPSNAAVLLILLKGGYYQTIGNAEIIAIAAFGLFTAAGCMHMLKRWGKQPYHNWHKQ